MKNKTLGISILMVLGLAVLAGIFETSMRPETSDNIYMVLGLAFFVLGIWTSIRLINSDK